MHRFRVCTVEDFSQLSPPVGGAVVVMEVSGDDMDAQSGENDDGASEAAAAETKDSKTKGFGSSGDKATFFRADKIDLKSFDIHLDRLWSGVVGRTGPKEAWEIDLCNLEIQHEVARGRHGTVYRGTYDGRDVAVEVLDWGEDDMATLRASFRQEFAVWHKLDHPNVTKFVGASMRTAKLKVPQAGESSNGHTSFPAPAWCCVVAEYLSGRTLKHYLIKNIRKKLPYKTVVQLALDLAKGLRYLHSQKIVHRDVKTENMLLDSHGTLKIADFGVARFEAENPQDMTGETGTLGYMAPEVLDGKPYNRKCDVYSFGICLWEIYCCDMPYADLSFSDACGVVKHNLRPDIPRCCPSAMASIMRKCWNANPDKRPDMDEVVRLLEALDTSRGGGMIPEDQAHCGLLCFRPRRGP